MRHLNRVFADLPLLSLVLMCFVGCSAQRDPELALREAESRLQANDPAEAERILRDVLPNAPQDARLQIALGRAELALGNATGAEGSFLRAMNLGGSKDEVAAYLAQSILAQGAARRTIKLIGDLQQWPQERRLVLATTKAEAELALAGYNKRDLTRHFVEVFRLRAAAEEHGAAADAAWVDGRLADLRAKHAIVAAAYEHSDCIRNPQVESDRSSSSPDPIGTTRRVLKVGPGHPLKRVRDAARMAQDNDIIEIEAGRYVWQRRPVDAAWTAPARREWTPSS